jgi:hypothetical protein
MKPKQQRTLKDRVKTKGIRLTEKDQKRLALMRADHIADKLRDSIEKVTRLHGKLYAEMRIVEDFLRMSAPFAAKSESK